MKKVGKILIVLVCSYILLGIAVGLAIGGALEDISFWSQSPGDLAMWLLLWPLWLFWHWVFFWS